MNGLYSIYMNPNDNSKSHFINNNYFNERSEQADEQIHERGSLGGEISAELGFKDLASAKDYVDQYKGSEDELAQDNSENEENEITSSS